MHDSAKTSLKAAEQKLKDNKQNKTKTKKNKKTSKHEHSVTGYH